MKYSNTVEYNISTKLDSSGLQKLRTELQQVELTLQKMGNKKLLDGSFSEAREQIQGLGDALSKAFNPSLGVLDLSTFKSELQSSGVTAKGLKDAFTQAGSEGQIAFNNLIGQLGQLDTGIQRSNSQIDKLFTTFSNTFRWGLVSSFFSQFMNAIHNSVDYVKELDDSLTQIMLVTDYNRDSMNEYAKSANEAAKALSMSTTGMTNASLVFAQQGYDLGQSQELASLSAKLANASQQDTATTSDQITAYMNAYGLEGSIEELTQQMDNWALIANISAADVGELAQASQRAASMANAVGVSGEQLAAQIATIESVTREAPEQIGNGLKTLYARFSDIAAGGEDEDGFDLGKVTSELNAIGVQIFDQMGQIRDVGDIMEDLMVIWDDLDQTSKVAASQALAGKYQVNRFMALMDNTDMYQEYKGATGSAATGTLDQMNQEYAESLAGRTQKLNTTLEGLFNDVFTTDMVYPLIDALTKLADAVDTLFKSVGSGPTIILGLASAFTRLFSNNIAEQINNAAMNKAVQQQRIENSQNRGALLEQLKVANPDESNQNTQAIINYAQRINELAPNLSSEQWEQANQILKEMVQNANAATQAQGELKTQLEAVGTVIGSVFGDKFKAPFLDDAGGINATALIEDLKTANLADSKDAIQATKEELLTFNQGLQQLQQELNKTEAADRDFNNAIDFMSQSLVRLKDYMEPGLYNRLNTVFDNLSESVTNGDYSIEEITTTIKQFEGETGRVIEFLDKLSNKELSTQEIENFIKKLEELAFKAKNTEGAAEGSNKLGTSYLKAAEKQLNVKDIVDIIANIGQLSFAWQSFQSLGSLWQKTDISTGEKIQQTIANLTASLPMLYTGWKKITEILKIPSFKDSTSNIQQAKDAITNAQNEIAQAQEKINKANNKAQGGFKALSTTLNNTGNGAAGFAKKASNGMHEVAQAAEEMDKAQKDAAAATADLRQAQLSLIGSLAFAAITAGLAIASAAWGAYQQKVQNAMSAEKEALEEAKNTANETSSAVQEWQKLYDKYLETGEASDALVDSSEQLSEKLGILGGDAYAAAGNFEKLAEEIQNAADADAQNAIKEAKRLLDGTYGKSASGDLPFNGSVQEDYSKALNDSTFDVTSKILTGSGVTEATAQIRDWIYEAELMPQAADSIADSIGKAHQALSLLEEKQDEVQEKLKADPANQYYIDLNEQLTKAHQNLSEFLNIEDVKATEDAYKTIAENTLRLSDTQKSLNGFAENGMPGEELLNYIGTLDGVSDYFKDLETNADKARFAITLLGDGAASAAIELDSLFDKDSNTFDNFSDEDKDSIKTSLNESGLTPEEQLKVAVSIDEEQSLAEVQNFIEQVAEKVENGTEISTAISEIINEGTELGMDTVETQLAEMKPIDPDIAEESFQNLANYIHDNWENLEELNEALGESAQFLETDAEYVADVTEAILRYQDALDESAEKMEDWLEALDSGDLEERSNAINEIKDSMEDFLNLDAGSLSDDFVEAEDNIQLFQDALAGVDGAYNELLEKALVNKFQLDVDNEPAMAALDDCLTALDNFDGYANTDFGPLTLDDSQAIAALENVINAFGMSSEAAQEFAKSMGYEIEVEPVDVQQEGQSQMTGWTPEIAGGVDLTAETFVAGPPLSGAAGLSASLQGGGVAPVNLTKGPPLSAHMDGVTFNPQTDQEKETKNTPLTQIKTKTGNGETSGGLKIKSLKRIAPTGGGKAANTSRPSSSGSGGRGGSCFVAGTLISTSFGYKPIELIKSNDFVLSYNELLHQNEYSKVIQTMIHDTIEPIYTLYIKNEQLRVTGIHRFLVSKDINFKPQWIAAQDLQIGDWVLLADNTWHLIWKIEVNLEHQIVYNFEVAGNHNYYVGRNQILAHNKGGSGKKGGGGSGSGQKAKTAKKKEAEKAEKKYYEEVNKQLEQTKETLDSLEKVTDKLTGTQARAKQNEQLKMLQKEKDLQEKKLKILQEQEKVDVSSAIKKADKDFEDLLKKQGVNFNLLDFTFDEEGFIDNLDSVRESIANGINKLNDQYNAIIGDDGEVTDEEQERLKALDEEIQKLEKLGKEVEKNGTRYNEIVIEEQKIQNEMQEIQDQMQDIAIDAYKASQEAIDNLKDLRKEWAKFSAGLYDSSKGESFLSLDNPIRQLKEIENEISSIYAVSGTEARKYYDDVIAQQQKYLENAKTADEQQAYKDAIEYYEKLRDSIDDGAVLNNGLMQLALNDLTRLQEIWNNWNDEGGNGFFGDDKAALEKALEDAQKRVMEFAQDFEELIEDLKDASLDVVDHTMEQWDRQLDRYDRVIDQLDRYSDTYSLIYGDASYDMQEAVLSQQAQTLKSELDTAQEAYLAANTYYLEAYEKFVDKSTGLAKEGYEDYMYELEEAMNDAEDKVRDIAADAAEKFSEAFEAAVMASTQYILRNTIGENDFEHSDRNWEWDKEYIDKYKDGVEKAYEMDKLRNRYIDMLNNAQGASLQTQNKIRAQMQEQLDLLDGQKTVSEYDVKLANAKLEILQKQIALEDAQRNKNKMQLRRDTQGNYRYVYTADKDNVDQAQQELLDSEYDAYEMSKQQQMNNYDDMINAYKRYLSQREEILTNNNLSEAQKMEQIKELWDRFQKYVNAAQEDFGDATAGTVDILQWLVVNGTDYTATAATDMLNQLLDAEGNVAEQSGVIWMDLANNMANEVIPSIADAVTTADNVIEQKLVQTGIALVGEDGTGGVFGEVSNGANDFGDQCEMAANQTAILSEQSNKLKEALLGDSGAFKQAQEELANYQKQLEDVTNASAITAQTLRATQQALDQAKAENLNYRTQIDRLLSGQDIIVNHKIVDAEEYRRQQEEEKRKQQQRNSGGGGGRNALADARAIWYHGAWGNGGDWYTPYSRQFGTAAANKVLWYFNHGYGYNFDFDTGGYTGEWNQGEGVSSHKNGKLAFLHQKELILNAQDTENILSAVSMVRSLANSAQASMNNINTAASGNINSIYNPVTEQRVDIQASFPNATDAEDIRQALIGLSDRAYQYAHRVI